MRRNINAFTEIKLKQWFWSTSIKRHINLLRKILIKIEKIDLTKSNTQIASSKITRTGLLNQLTEYKSNYIRFLQTLTLKSWLMRFMNILKKYIYVLT